MFKSGRWGEERETPRDVGGVKELTGSKSGILNTLANITKVI